MPSLFAQTNSSSSQRRSGSSSLARTVPAPTTATTITTTTAHTSNEAANTSTAASGAGLPAMEEAPSLNRAPSANAATRVFAAKREEAPSCGPDGAAGLKAALSKTTSSLGSSALRSAAAHPETNDQADSLHRKKSLSFVADLRMPPTPAALCSSNSAAKRRAASVSSAASDLCCTEEQPVASEPTSPSSPFDSPDGFGPGTDALKMGASLRSDIYTVSCGGSEAAADLSSGADESLNSDTATSNGGRSRVSRTGGSSTNLEVCGRKIKIPFTVWTFLAMAVPVTMLLITALIPTAEAADDLARVARFRPLAHDVSDCVTAAAAEDHTAHLFVYHPTPAAEQAYRAAQAEVDRVCDAVLLSDLREIAASDSVFDKKRDEMQSSFRALREQRTLFDFVLSPNMPVNASVHNGPNITTELSVRLPAMRAALDALMSSTTNTIARVAAVIRSETARLFVDLKLVGDARVKLWLAASTGSALLATEHPSTAEFVGFVTASATATAAIGTIEGAASPDVASLALSWHHRAGTEAMFAELHSVLAENSPDAAAHHDEARFAALMEGPLAELRDVETDIVHMIDESAASKDSVARNVSLLAVGIVLSAVAAGLLARQQLRVQSVLTKQVERVETTKKAVSAFVPRFFLNKMGYTSITQVCVGDSAEVALTMLFADIRKFTTVAEDMTSRELFNWVQGYFRLMTTIIEGHHGNINQFIGDALFALFSTAKDGVACAVDMQAKTQQLNLERLCMERNAVPLNIGIGLHHDVLSLGILGDDKRHTCTAISASVNLASRLEGLTKQLGCRILASEAVVDQLGPTVQAATALRRVGPAQVKGSGEPVPVYDIFQADERALQGYKTATAATFAEYTRLALPGREPNAEERAQASALRSELQAAAERHDTSDLVLAAIDTFGAKGDGRLRFDAK